MRTQYDLYPVLVFCVLTHRRKTSVYRSSPNVIHENDDDDANAGDGNDDDDPPNHLNED